MKLVHYRLDYITRRNETVRGYLPGMRNFRGWMDIYGHTATPIDRSETIKFPIKTKNLFPLPTLVPSALPYKELCLNRAIDLHEVTIRNKARTLSLFWSGGVDSTCALVSILMVWPGRDLERVTVYLTEESLHEYPLFYEKF